MIVIIRTTTIGFGGIGGVLCDMQDEHKIDIDNVHTERLDRAFPDSGIRLPRVWKSSCVILCRCHLFILLCLMLLILACLCSLLCEV